jgi:hypothetical protein
MTTKKLQTLEVNHQCIRDTPPKAKRWWTKELEEERDIQAEARRTTPPSSDQLKQARNRWLRAIRKAKRECWERFLQASDPGQVWKAINAKPQSYAMPPTLTSTSGEEYRTLEETIELIANISFPSNPVHIPTIAQDKQEREESGDNTDSIDRTGFTVCPNILKPLVKRTCNTLAPGLDGIGWRKLKIWFKLDPKGLCQIINELIKTGLPPELKVTRVVVIVKPSRRDRTKVKAYRCIYGLPTIGKLVEKAITLHLANQSEINGWWHPSQHGSRARRNTTDALLWLIRRVRENRSNKKHTAVLMVDVSPAFPNTSRNEVRETPTNRDPGIVRWVD